MDLASVAWLLLTILTTPVWGAVELSADQKKELIRTHNNFRILTAIERNVSNMLEMEWDEALEQHSRNWVDGCKFQRSPVSTRRELSGDYFDAAGQNLLRGRPEASNLTSMVQFWHMENQWYNHWTHTCQRNKVCSHYRQLIWADTYKVGCALSSPNQCSMGRFFVCTYAPGASSDFFTPYETGDVCSDCPSEWINCDVGLCGKGYPAVTVTTASQALLQDDGFADYEVVPGGSLNDESDDDAEWE